MTAPDRTSDVFKQLEKDVEQLREDHRAGARPMSSANRLMAQSFGILADRQREAGSLDDAVASLKTAESWIERALAGSPNNRIWRLAMARTKFQHAQLLADAEKTKEARAWVNLTIHEYVRVLAADPGDHETRKECIRALVLFGELSEQLNQPADASRGFMTAAQDCHLIIVSGRFSWAKEVRIWGLAKARENILKSDRKAEWPGTRDVMTRMYEREKTDHTFRDRNFRDWAIRVLDGKEPVPPRPDDLLLWTSEMKTH